MQVAAELGIRNAVSFDMGGTSTDVSLIREGEASTSSRSEVAGFPISLPQIRIETVSAGGGSIASIDSGGLLHVGPQSAGSSPGPACYGFGGGEPTVTDAAFLIGLLRASHFFGGQMELDEMAADRAYARLAGALGASAEEAAEKVFTIANHKMANAVRIVSIREGHDPRDYALFAFGGAGPLHACGIAEELGIRRVVVPMYPGAFSAYGLLCADLKRDFVRSVLAAWSTLDDARIRAWTNNLTAEAADKAGELSLGTPFWIFQAECRYRGQAYEVAVDIPEQGPVAATMLSNFHESHHRQFGFSNPDAEVELVNIRATAIFRQAKPVLPKLARANGGPASGFEMGRIFAGGRWREARFVDRGTLAEGDSGSGTTVIEETTATSYVPAGWSYQVESAGHLVMDRD
jgi:N-methylhydantoinase A